MSHLPLCDLFLKDSIMLLLLARGHLNRDGDGYTEHVKHGRRWRRRNRPDAVKNQLELVLALSFSVALTVE